VIGACQRFAAAPIAAAFLFPARVLVLDGRIRSRQRGAKASFKAPESKPVVCEPFTA
jgi:hypothetical protein